MRGKVKGYTRTLTFDVGINATSERDADIQTKAIGRAIEKFMKEILPIHLNEKGGERI